ncbi:hypothetical protein BpHYR1_031157, partial [Brachionus plicatilis]
NGKCSCRWYIKNNICKHLIGISKILNIPECEIPLSAKNIPIGEKRKPGRPAKAKQALIIQIAFVNFIGHSYASISIKNFHMF